MHDVEVQFFEDSDRYNPGSPQRVHSKSYSYQSFVALEEGDVVIVPTYGDRYPNLRLAFAKVVRVRPTDGEGNPTLRFVVQKLDLAMYEQLRAQQRDREVALRMLKSAKAKRQRAEEFLDVKAFLNDDEESFIRKTLEFDFEEVMVEGEKVAMPESQL